MPGRYRDVEPGRLLDEGDQIEETSHGPLVRTSNGQHDAELGRADRGRLSSRLEHLPGVEEGGGEDRRVEA